MNLYVSCSNWVQTVVNTTAIFWTYVTQICDLRFLVLFFINIQVLLILVHSRILPNQRQNPAEQIQP